MTTWHIKLRVRAHSVHPLVQTELQYHNPSNTFPRHHHVPTPRLPPRPQTPSLEPTCPPPPPSRPPPTPSQPSKSSQTDDLSSVPILDGKYARISILNHRVVPASTAGQSVSSPSGFFPRSNKTDFSAAGNSNSKTCQGPGLSCPAAQTPTTSISRLGILPRS